jgi:hypothetical protein
MRIDLHAHSTASDGVLAPAALVADAARAGVGVLGLTDHDSLEALPAALAAAQEVGVVLVPGVELSVGPVDGRDVHILGYFVDPGDRRLQERLSFFRAARLDRAARMVTALSEAGIDIALADVLALAEDGAVGRSHVARALVNGGHVASVDEAFERYLSRGRPFYHAKSATDPAEAVHLLVDAGAVPVLAHPGLSDADDLIPGLVAAGLVGIEAYHADHSPQDQARYEHVAHSLGLLVTGGSDHHGPGTPSAPLGSVDVPDHVWPDLLAHAPAHYRAQHPPR